jgi:hypothetical protein
MDQPIVLSAKALLAFLLATMILAAGVAVAAAQFSDTPSADAAAGNAAVVKQLKAANSTLKAANSTLSQINASIGSYDYSGSSLRRNTKETANAVVTMCIAVAASPSSC